jgi:hypothetical protein
MGQDKLQSPPPGSCSLGNFESIIDIIGKESNTFEVSWPYSKAKEAEAREDAEDAAKNNCDLKIKEARKEAEALKKNEDPRLKSSCEGQSTPEIQCIYDSRVIDETSLCVITSCDRIYKDRTERFIYVNGEKQEEPIKPFFEGDEETGWSCSSTDGKMKFIATCKKIEKDEEE